MDRNTQFLKELTDAGFKPHDESETLYKYTSFDTAKIILESGSFRFSSPLKFNDPFEMSIDFLNFQSQSSEVRSNIFNNIRK